MIVEPEIRVLPFESYGWNCNKLELAKRMLAYEQDRLRKDTEFGWTEYEVHKFVCSTYDIRELPYRKDSILLDAVILILLEAGVMMDV